MSRLSKILFILAVIVALGVIGYFIYIRFFASALPDGSLSPAAANDIPVDAKLPVVLKQLSAQPALRYWVNQKTNALYYASPDGKIYKTFGDGRDEAVSEQTLADLHDVTPSPDGARALASFNYPLRETFALFDTTTNSWERLPEDVVAAAFDPGSQKLAYLKNGLSSGLYVVTLGDRKTTQVLPLAVADGILAWQTANELLLFSRPTSRVRSEIFLIDLAKKIVRPIDDANSAMYAFLSTDLGLRFVVAGRADFELQLMDGTGRALNALPFLTLPSKCAVNATVLYCAIPASFPLRSELPDDYLKEKFFTQDSFVSYDIPTGATTLLPEIAAVVDADQLLVQDNKILFRNRIDEKVYSFEFRARATEESAESVGQ